MIISPFNSWWVIFMALCHFYILWMGMCTCAGTCQGSAIYLTSSCYSVVAFGKPRTSSSESLRFFSDTGAYGKRQHAPLGWNPQAIPGDCQGQKMPPVPCNCHLHPGWSLPRWVSESFLLNVCYLDQNLSITWGLVRNAECWGAHAESESAF